MHPRRSQSCEENPKLKHDKTHSGAPLIPQRSISWTSVTAIQPYCVAKPSVECRCADNNDNNNNHLMRSISCRDVWHLFSNSQALAAFLFAYSFSYAMRLFITQDLLLTKTCRYHLHLSADVCHQLYVNETHFPLLKDSIERIANNYSLYILLVQLTPSAILAIFLGPWTDKYGYKLPLFIATLGGLIQDIGTIVTVVHMRAPLFWNIICGIPNGLCGSIVCILAAVCSDAARTSTSHARTVQFLIILVVAMVGMACGQFVAGEVFRAGGYLPVFIVSASILIASLVWIAFVVPNSCRQEAQKASIWTKIYDLLQWKNLYNGFAACLKPRPNKGRTKLLLLITSMCVVLFVAEGTRGINYFYTKKMYNWDVSKYSDISSGFLVFRLVAVCTFVLVANLVFNMSDCTMALVGISCSIFQSLITGLASAEYMFYISYIVGTLEASAPIGIKSYVSKLLSTEETSQIFSVWLALEALTPVIGCVFGSQVYNASIDLFPGLPYFIYIAFLFYPLLSVAYCRYIQIKQSFPTAFCALCQLTTIESKKTIKSNAISLSDTMWLQKSSTTFIISELRFTPEHDD